MISINSKLPIVSKRFRVVPVAIAAGTAFAGNANAQATFIVEIPRAEAAEGIFLEGPVWHPTAGLLVSDIPGDRTLKLEPDNTVSVYRAPTGQTNGMILDREGRLIAAEDQGCRIVRYEHNGTKTNLTDNYRGQRLNSPNDLAIDNAGRIYFTDPGYRNRETKVRKDSSGRIVDGVYRIDAPGEIEMILAHEITYPNGVAVSPDNSFLYVAELGPSDDGGVRNLWRFALSADGDVVPGTQTLMYDWGDEGGPDGMAVDVAGNIYVAAGLTDPGGGGSQGYVQGIVVFSPDGEIVEFLPTHNGELPTANVTFGGADNDVLYIAAGNQLWEAPALAPGYVAGAD